MISWDICSSAILYCVSVAPYRDRCLYNIQSLCCWMHVKTIKNRVRALVTEERFQRFATHTLYIWLSRIMWAWRRTLTRSSRISSLVVGARLWRNCIWRSQRFCSGTQLELYHIHTYASVWLAGAVFCKIAETPGSFLGTFYRFMGRHSPFFG